MDRFAESRAHRVVASQRAAVTRALLEACHFFLNISVLSTRGDVLRLASCNGAQLTSQVSNDAYDSETSLVSLSPATDVCL
jgi:hypothetical protein